MIPIQEEINIMIQLDTMTIKELTTRFGLEYVFITSYSQPTKTFFGLKNIAVTDYDHYIFLITAHDSWSYQSEYTIQL